MNQTYMGWNQTDVGLVQSNIAVWPTDVAWNQKNIAVDKKEVAGNKMNMPQDQMDVAQVPGNIGLVLNWVGLVRGHMAGEPTWVAE